MSVGNNIKKFRKGKKLTQEELANLISVSPKTISSYENNRNLPNIETLILLSQVLDVSVDEIIGSSKKEKAVAQKYYEKKTEFNIIAVLIISIYSFIYLFMMNYIISGSLILTEYNLSLNDLVILISKYSIYYILSATLLYTVVYLKNQKYKIKLIAYISSFVLLFILAILIFCL